MKKSRGRTGKSGVSSQKTGAALASEDAVRAECVDPVPAKPHRVEDDVQERSKLRTQIILDSISELVAFQNPDLTLAWVNRAAAESAGADPVDLVGRRCYEVWDRRQDPCPECPVLEAMQRGVPASKERLASDGRWWIIHAYPVLDEERRVVGAVEVTVDITEERRAQEALKASEATFRGVLGAAPLGIGLVKDRVIGWTSEKTSEMTGYTARELDGMSARVLYESDEEFERVGRVKYAMIREKGVGTVETRWRRKDGRVIDVLLSTAAIDPKDVSRGVFTATDITDLKRTETALRISETQYRTTLESMGDAVHVIDRDFRITLFNPAFRNWNEKLGLTTDTLDRDLFEVFPFLSDAVRQEYERVFEAGETLHTEEQSRIGGQVYFTDTRKIPVYEGGRVARVVTVIRDITEKRRAEKERERLEDQVRHAQKLESLGVLAGGIAHDFNNILMGVLGNADLALSDLPPNSPTREYLEAIGTAAKRAADLCRQMLAYSGRGRFVVQDVDVGELVREMAHLLEVSISKRVILRYEFAGALPPVEADATQLRQIVLNLITNASEAIGEDSGVIRVSTGVASRSREDLGRTLLGRDLPEGNYVFLEVQDTGCGMNADTLAKIFDPFFSTKFTGRGLGLAAVLGIVRGHRGTLSVESAPGRGTTFCVHLPVFRGRRKPAVGKPAVQAEWTPAGTVLVIDDEETVRSVAQRMLERAGLTVLTAAKGREGVDLYRRHAGEIVAVVLDLTMPEMSGEETLHELRKVDAGVRVILASGYSEHELSERFADRGLAGFVQKPFGQKTILEKLREAVRRA